MKYFFLAFLLSLSVLSADIHLGQVIDSEVPVSYSYCQKEPMIGLSDGSCWKLKPMKEKRKQSWTEWFKGVEPKEWQLEKSYFFDPLTWKGAFTVSVHKVKQPLFSKYCHILVNDQTGEKAFAEYVAQGTTFVPKLQHAMNLINQATQEMSSILDIYPFLGNIIVLENGSCWRVYFSQENSRTLSEWFQDIKIDQPDKEFLSKIDDWHWKDEVEVYTTSIDDSYLQAKYEVVTLGHQTVLLYNKVIGKFAYASFVPFNELIEMMKQYAEDLSEKAYKQGYSTGYDDGYKKGHATGYGTGYREAVQDSQKRVEQSDSTKS